MSNQNEIAIIAMDCKVPGANNVNELWDLLLNEQCSIKKLDEAQLKAAGVSNAMISDPNFVPYAGTLDDVEKFDASYFEMNSREAEVLDVQQRQMLERAESLLDTANINQTQSNARVGVFSGSAFSTYLFGILEREDIMNSLGEMVVRQSNDKDFLAPRISYKLGLNGPSVNIQTACSTGLVSVHYASQSLLLGECDVAIAGAVHIKLPQHSGYKYQVGGVLSPDGVCRPFDRDAQGTVFTNGLGLVLLKRLEDAIQDCDEIIAVISGSAVNNDADKKVSFTAPSIAGQVDVINDALEIAHVDPAKVSYIEAHGTGTSMGDPIEIEAIKQAYGGTGSPCGIGSIKGNLGHLNIAAGILSLIKTALVIKNGTIPKSLHFTNPNPKLELGSDRFFIAKDQLKIEKTDMYYAAVSAFGMGGTNCHAILRNYESEAPAETLAKGPMLFTFSAKCKDSAHRVAESYAEFAIQNPNVSLADLSYTSFKGRKQMGVRGALVANHLLDLQQKLEAQDFHCNNISEKSAMAFVFGGQGIQNIEMGKNLAQNIPAFAEKLADTLKMFSEATNQDLGRLLWDPKRANNVNATDVAQPLIFAVEYSLASTFIEMGVEPGFLVGHSLGELVAATVSGVFDLSTAVGIVTKRSKLMADCKPGAMLSVRSLEPLEEMLQNSQLSMAAINATDQHVLAGSFEAIKEAEARCESAGAQYTLLKTSHAFHSPMMQDAANEFLTFMSTVHFGKSTIPIISNVTGKILGEYEYNNPAYWSAHILQTVKFGESIKYLTTKGVRRFIGIGPGHTIGNLVCGNLTGSLAKEVEIMHAMGSAEEEFTSYLDVLAMTWTCQPDQKIDSYIPKGNKILLPSYPFAHGTYWVNPVLGLARRRREANSSLTDNMIPETSLEKDAMVTSENRVKVAKTIINLSEVNPVETLVCQIYMDILGDEVDKNDLTFFELGGNSLMAIQLIQSLRENFKIDISMRGFYQKSSVSEISRFIAQRLLTEPEHV
jgi:acyl transferase domain-containing protein/acyl carrier protein